MTDALKGYIAVCARDVKNVASNITSNANEAHSQNALTEEGTLRSAVILLTSIADSLNALVK